MKKFLIPLFLALLISCSSEGFKSEIAASAQKDVWCSIIVEDKCIRRQISEVLCKEIGVPPCDNVAEVSSSSEEEISSSSHNTGSSSSRNLGVSSSRNASSSAGGTLSSSSGGAGSSSSGDALSSSSGDALSSSGGAVSSSSGGAVSSSSGGVVSSSSGTGSSSGGAVSSSSSSMISSSSSESPPPAWSECNIPQYVGRNEQIANLKFTSIENNNGRCGAITYRLNSTGQGQPVATLNYNENQIGTNQTLNITASTTCSGTTITKTCNKQVTVADYIKFSEANTDVILKPRRTVVDVGGVSADVFGCQARDNSESPNPFQGKTSFILDGKTASVTDNEWWVKTAITGNRMLFESNNANVGSYRCQIE